MATKKRLIDANELVSYLWVLFKFFGSIPCSEADKATQRAIKRCIGEVKKMPTVDAVEVVRCKDCKFSTEDGGYDSYEQMYTHLNCHKIRIGYRGCAIVPNDGFCSYGEKRDEGDG